MAQKRIPIYCTAKTAIAKLRKRECTVVTSKPDKGLYWSYSYGNFVLTKGDMRIRISERGGAYRLTIWQGGKVTGDYGDWYLWMLFDEAERRLGIKA